jgi:hypothetical protein
MCETAIIVRTDDDEQQITGRAAKIITRLLTLADQVNRETQGCITFHFKGSSLTTVREYREEPA